MFTYALRRSLGAIPTLLIVVAVAFFLVRLAPGGPFDLERNLPPETEARLLAQYNLDQPVHRQFLDYLGGLLRGDFGPSFHYRDYSVAELIAAGFPVSLILGASAMALALLAGIAAGVVAALRHNSWADHTLMSVAMVGISVPNFVMAPLLILLFAIVLDWLPAGGLGGAWLRPRNMVLPVLTLALPQVGFIARLTRASMIEIMHSDFIRTARAKGLPRRMIVLRHALRPALLPVVSYLGPATAGIITGSVVIEQIFGIPGLGRYFVQGALNRDYTLVMGVVIFFATLIVLFNLLVDLAYGLLDPRVRYR